MFLIIARTVHFAGVHRHTEQKKKKREYIYINSSKEKHTHIFLMLCPVHLYPVTPPIFTPFPETSAI